MCDKCKQLDKKIQSYRKFLTHGFDRLTVERIDGLIAELEQRKKENCLDARGT
jgi:hypothetical protein